MCCVLLWRVLVATTPLFFFNDTATTEIYTLSLHDALPILAHARRDARLRARAGQHAGGRPARSEEHTSELQSRFDLVCRLLLEKKKTYKIYKLSIESKIISTQHQSRSVVLPLFGSS